MKQTFEIDFCGDKLLIILYNGEPYDSSSCRPPLRRAAGDAVDLSFRRHSVCFRVSCIFLKYIDPIS